MSVIPRQHILAKLYHELGRQCTDFALQHSKRDGDHVTWTRRYTFLSLDPEKQSWFVEHANHRQILKNEIIADFDRDIPPDRALRDFDVQTLIKRLKEEDWAFCVYHTGSKGVHVHVYFTALINCDRQQREDFRLKFLKHFKWFANVDLQKVSDASMIALEHVPHWKTGIKKTLLFSHGVDAWT